MRKYRKNKKQYTTNTTNTTPFTLAVIICLSSFSFQQGTIVFDLETESNSIYALHHRSDRIVGFGREDNSKISKYIVYDITTAYRPTLYKQKEVYNNIVNLGSTYVSLDNRLVFARQSSSNKLLTQIDLDLDNAATFPSPSIDFSILGSEFITHKNIAGKQFIFYKQGGNIKIMKTAFPNSAAAAVISPTNYGVELFNVEIAYTVTDMFMAMLNNVHRIDGTNDNAPITYSIPASGRTNAKLLSIRSTNSPFEGFYAYTYYTADNTFPWVERRNASNGAFVSSRDIPFAEPSANFWMAEKKGMTFIIFSYKNQASGLYEVRTINTSNNAITSVSIGFDPAYEVVVADAAGAYFLFLSQIPGKHKISVFVMSTFACSGNCLQCIGAAANQCSKCDKKDFRKPEASGVCACPVTEVHLGSLVCQPCADPFQYVEDNTCKTCPGGSIMASNECTSCAQNKYSDPSTNTCKICPKTNQYPKNNICEDCTTNCLTCNLSECLSCKAELIQDVNNKLQCIPVTDCEGNCSTCKILDRKKCSSCPLYHYYTESENTCNSCATECNTCNDSPNNCTSCFRGSSLVDGKCEKDEKTEEDLVLKVLYFDQTTLQISCEFSHTIFEDDDFKSNINVSLTEKNEKKEIKIDTISISKTAKNRLIIDLNLDGITAIDKGQFLITTKSKNGFIRRSQNLEKYFTDYPIKLDNINFFLPKTEIKTISTATSLTSIAITTTQISIVVFTGGSGAAGAATLNFQSQFPLMSLIGSSLPSNAQTFLLATSSGSLKSILPDWGKIDESDYVCFLDEKFRKSNFECLTYNNIRHVFLITILVVLIKSFLALSSTIIMFYEKKNVIPEERSIFKRVLLLVNRQMGKVLLTKILFALQIEILTGTMVGLQNIKFEGWKGISNLIFSAVILVLYLLYIITVGFVCYQQGFGGKQEDPHFYKTWEFVVIFLREMKDNTKIGKFFFALKIVRDFMLPFLLIVFIFNPYFQVPPLIVVLLFKGSFTIMSQPFIYMVDNIVNFLLEIIFALTIFLILLTEIFSSSATEEQRYKYFGYIIILLLALMMITKLVLTLLSIGFMGYKIIFGKKIKEDPLTKWRKEISRKLRSLKYNAPAQSDLGCDEKPVARMVIDKLRRQQMTSKKKILDGRTRLQSQENFGSQQ